MHMKAEETDIEQVEGRAALSFLAIDDLPVGQEGECIHPDSIITLKFEDNRPVFPDIKPSISDPFLNLVHSPDKKWIILVDQTNEPRAALDADGLLRSALLGNHPFNPLHYCHRYIVIKDAEASLGSTIPRLKVHSEQWGDDVIDEDIIIFWSKERRIITGSDILGRLLRGIASHLDDPFMKHAAKPV